jgi:hypothetical protein
MLCFPTHRCFIWLRARSASTLEYPVHGTTGGVSRQGSPLQQIIGRGAVSLQHAAWRTVPSQLAGLDGCDSRIRTSSAARRRDAMCRPRSPYNNDEHEFDHPSFRSLQNGSCSTLHETARCMHAHTRACTLDRRTRAQENFGDPLAPAYYRWSGVGGVGASLSV